MEGTQRQLKPEELARKHIDKHLEKTGWKLLKQGAKVPNKGSYALPELEVKGKFADYVLYIDGEIWGICDATLVAVSEDTHKSEWVNWEVEESIRRGKGVVVVNISKKDSVKMPAAVEANKDKIKVVQWKHEQIMSAIDEAAEKR